ncbi:MAG: DUF1553 domain-containing protein [Planctomycetota bacterium]|nr:DUF1553 domain-containing protein [Planctomycetota bacterium]
MQVRLVILVIAFSLTAFVSVRPRVTIAQSVHESATQEKIAFFESKIRPALIEHCIECHSVETEASGGLLLDSKSGWSLGGDSGPAITPGDADASRLLAAITYSNPDLQMPPDGELPAETVDAFRQWIEDGAIDSRQATSPLSKPQVGMPVEKAKHHWAYKELQFPKLPNDYDSTARSPIDYFVEHQLNIVGLQASGLAEPNALVRRLYFDLTGLPPPSDTGHSVELIAQGDKNAYEKLVDQLLESPRFGERFARNWMDVVRYAESITLRGFVLPEAWRYRDYLIEAFAEDRPFDQMLREQIAGDLMHSDDLHERQQQLTATTFLAVGNTNLEEQDKAQLEMDYVDEQLEVIGRAFLGQTIGCARCHDHKFDPIPTSDYYALAGILHASVALEHANLSKWIEKPLPVSESEKSHYAALEKQLASIDDRMAKLNQATDRKLAKNVRAIPVEELDGVVVDSRKAKLVGTWKESTTVGRFVGDGYIHDENSDKGTKTATFEPSELAPGQYRIRLAYSASENRASNTIVRISSADGETLVRVDQRIAPPEEAIWVSLGEFRFEKDGQAFVLVTNDESDGHVVVDAIQFLPIGTESKSLATKPEDNSNDQDAKQKENDRLLAKDLASLKAERKQVEKALASRPRFMTIVEQKSPANCAIHIRGDVHNLGEVVPRGFLSAIDVGTQIHIAENSSGRLELARWLSHPSNPLTARVYANRVWYWLMGQGIVSSVNNFGTTGTQPTHPELLEWLSSELIRSGWSTKHLVRTIVMSDAYRRRISNPTDDQQRIDPSNRYYWRGHSRRLTAESIRDSMLKISGELDLAMGGSMIPVTTKEDYGFKHDSARRSIYQPVFRNSLPDLFDVFDFADASVSVGERPRSTVSSQALVLLNHPWVSNRAKAAAERYQKLYMSNDQQDLIRAVFHDCLYRDPTAIETSESLRYLGDSLDSNRLQLFIHSIFASLDFRYLD